MAELAANAALHGPVRGRDFRLDLTLNGATGVLLIEVTDTRHDKASKPGPPPDSESGRGLLLVDALADRRGTDPHLPCGKTVWAELDPGQAHEWETPAPRPSGT